MLSLTGRAGRSETPADEARDPGDENWALSRVSRVTNTIIGVMDGYYIHTEEAAS